MSAVDQAGLRCGTGLFGCPLQLFPVPLLYCKSWWHESPRQTMVLLGSSKGLSVTTLPTVGSGHQVGAGDTWEQILDRGHRTWPPSLLFLWIPCQRAFFSFASVWLIQTSHCASRARLVLWHLHHTWRLKGKGTINYSRLSRWLCKGKKKNEKQWEGANLSLLGSKACTVLFFSFLCWLFCCEE